MTKSEVLATHGRQTNLQKEWEGRKQAAERAGLPFTEPFPAYTVTGQDYRDAVNDLRPTGAGQTWFRTVQCQVVHRGA